MLGLRFAACTEFGAHGKAFLAVDKKSLDVCIFKTLEDPGIAWFDTHAPILARGGLRGMVHMTGGGLEPFAHAIFAPLYGSTLESFAAGIGAFKARSALRVVLEVTGILAAVGSAGLLHPGLCAQNVFLGADAHVTVLDWGLPGTPSGYRAPELDSGKVTVASEVYALGSLLFRMIAGFEPHRPRTAAESFDQFGKLLQAGHAPKLVTVLERCMAFDPSTRFSCHSELLFVVGRMLHEAIEDAPEELGDVDDASMQGGVRAEIDQKLDWLDESDGGFPTDARDQERRRSTKSTRRPADAAEVSTKATASALDAMRAELTQSFRKGQRTQRKPEDEA